SDERARDEELRRAQKLDALGRLAGEIAHDYNNMLLAIAGNLDLALAAKPPVDIERALAAARAAVARSLALTRPPLALARRGPTTASASTRSSRSGCSSRSTRRDATARASVSRPCTASSRATAAPSRSTRRRAREPASASACGRSRKLYPRDTCGLRLALPRKQ